MNDHEPGLATLLDRLTPRTDAVPDWADALRRAEQTPGRRLPAWRFAGVGVAGAVVALLVILLVGFWGGKPSIVDRANAALALKPQTILHERFNSTLTDPASGTVTRTSEEIWLGDGGRFRAIRTTPGSPPQEFGRAGRHQPLVTFNPGTNALKSDCVASYDRFRDPVAVIREYLAAGRMKVVGHTTLNGRQVVKLRGVSSSETDELYVDRNTYYPVRLTSRFSGRQHGFAVIQFTTYRYEPVTPATRTLANIRSQHRHAKLVDC
jgi:hypothetical protein